MKERQHHSTARERILSAFADAADSVSWNASRNGCALDLRKPFSFRGGAVASNRHVMVIFHGAPTHGLQDGSHLYKGFAVGKSRITDRIVKVSDVEAFVNTWPVRRGKRTSDPKSKMFVDLGRGRKAALLLPTLDKLLFACRALRVKELTLTHAAETKAFIFRAKKVEFRIMPARIWPNDVATMWLSLRPATPKKKHFTHEAPIQSAIDMVGKDRVIVVTEN